MSQKEIAENNIVLYTLIWEVGNNRPLLDGHAGQRSAGRDDV